METAKSQVPSCVRCDKRLFHVTMEAPNDNWDIQPSGGLILRTYGNYGSTYYDPFPGDTEQYLLMNICDKCAELLEGRNQIRRHTNSHGE